MLRDVISDREEELPASSIGKLLEISSERKDIISLGPGEPDFPSPPHVLSGARDALRRKRTHYTSPAGMSELREAVSRKLKRDNKIDCGADGVIITCGSTESLLLSLMSVVDPGEGVIIPDPGFLSYRPMIEVLNGMPVPIPLSAEGGFEYDVDLMRDSVAPEKTKALIINTPSNPTGGVMTKKNLEEIADFANEFDLLILADEAYEKLVYGKAKHISMASLNGMGERTITFQTFSKSYAMPGFRLGYAAGPEHLIRAMARLHVLTSVCAPSISQEAGLAALGERKGVERMRKEYDRRRRMMVRRVRAMKGLECTEPEGAFYLFPNIEGTGLSSLGFTKALMEKAKVAVVPGTEFGRHGEGFVRMSYATEYRQIEKAMGRIEGFVDKL